MGQHAKRTQQRWLALAAMSAGMAALTTTKSALADSQWAGGNSGNWNTPGNWNPSGVPGAGANVDVTSTAGATQTITYNYTGSAVTLNTLTLDLTGGTGNASETITMSANNLTANTENIGDSGSGTSGSGTFDQTGGNNTITTVPTVNFVTLGYNTTDQGSYNLSGTGSLSGASVNEIIGYNGTGNFNQSGGNNSPSVLNLGYSPGSTGTYTLSGTGSLSTPVEFVGFQGTGTFNQIGGNNVIGNAGSGELDIGFTAPSVGVYNLSGGSVTVNGDASVGSTSTLTISNTGQMTVNGTLGLSPGSQNLLNLSGGSLTVGILNLNSSYSQFTWTGGTLTLSGATGENITIDSTGYSNFGDSAGTASSFILAAGQTLNVYGLENVGFYGTGSFTQTGGTNFVSLNLALGQNAGSTGTYTLTGGSSSLSVAGSERIGFSGTGIFIQTGGNNTVTDNVSVAFNSGAIGSYTLTGGTTSVAGDFNVGGQESAAGGAGTLTVGGSGSLNIAGTLTVYNTGGTGVNLTGGTIIASAFNFNGTPSLLNWTSGELNLNANVTWDSSASPTTTSDAFGSSLILGNNQTLAITGNETIGGTGPFILTLNTGSTHTVSGKLTVSSTPSLLNLSGGTLNANSLSIAAGALFRATQAGSANINANATISGTMSLDGESSFFAGNISIPNGGLLTLGNGFVSTATLTVSSGGQLLMNNSTASELNANVSNSGQITGAGQIFGTLTNNASGVLSVNSTPTLLITGPGSTNPGIIDLSGGALDFTQTLSDTGTIQGFGALTFGGNLTITSTGTLALAGSSSVSGKVTNNSGGTIHLSGSQPNAFFGNVTNNGNLTVDTAATGTFYGPYSGNGSISNNGSLFLNANSVSGAITGNGTLTLGTGIAPAILMFNSSSGTSKQSALTLNSTSQLDLTNNPLIIESTSGNKSTQLTQLKAEVAAGSAGSLTAPTIISSTAGKANQVLAIVDNAIRMSVFPGSSSTFGGQSVDADSILLTAAYLGDANLDGQVNILDLQDLANHWQQHVTDWSQADFNGDGIVDIRDLQDLANNWQAGVGAGGGSGQSFSEALSLIGNFTSSPSNVPEPASLALLLISGTALLTTRRRPANPFKKVGIILHSPFQDS